MKNQPRLSLSKKQLDMIWDGLFTRYNQLLRAEDNRANEYYYLAQIIYREWQGFGKIKNQGNKI